MRLEESEADMKKRLKANREHSKKWEAGREDRVGTWRDFAKGNKSKKVSTPKKDASLCDNTFAKRHREICCQSQKGHNDDFTLKGTRSLKI